MLDSFPQHPERRLGLRLGSVDTDRDGWIGHSVCIQFSFLYSRVVVIRVWTMAGATAGAEAGGGG